jgi:histidinol-phosphate aminotransferase
MDPYPPPNLREAAARAGIPVERLLRLDANENPYGPTPRVAEALGQHAGFGLYPDYSCLLEAIACYAGVGPEQVTLGNGSDELIDLVMRLILEPGQGLIICPPAFSMYEFFARLGRRRVWAVDRGGDFSIDTATIEALIEQRQAEERPRLLFLTSPGNPDGQIIPTEVVQRLLRLPIIVVVDEAYIEFGGPSHVRLLAEHENLIILRTFSKWAGLAGLRLGYALAGVWLTSLLQRIRAPYNINAAAVVAALATLHDLQTAQANVARLVSERERLHGALAAVPWVEPLPSQANFILCRVHDRDAHVVADGLAQRGILVRTFSEPRLRDAIRVSIGRPDQNDTLLKALHEQGMGESHERSRADC